MLKRLLKVAKRSLTSILLHLRQMRVILKISIKRHHTKLTKVLKMIISIKGINSQLVGNHYLVKKEVIRKKEMLLILKGNKRNLLLDLKILSLTKLWIDN